MTNQLAEEYLKRTKKRLEAVKLLFKEESYPEVVSESQEIVELCEKGILRKYGIDPPNWHDVGDLLIELSENLKKFKKVLKNMLKFQDG